MLNVELYYLIWELFLQVDLRFSYVETKIFQVLGQLSRIGTHKDLIWIRYYLCFIKVPEVVDLWVRSINYPFDIPIISKKLGCFFPLEERHNDVPCQIRILILDKPSEVIEGLRIFHPTSQYILPLLNLIFFINRNRPFPLIGHNSQPNIANLPKRARKKDMFISPEDIQQKLLNFPL